MAEEAAKEYALRPAELQKIVDFDHRDSAELTEKLGEQGGVEALATKLETDLSKGLPDVHSLEDRQAWFGRNYIEPPPSKTIFGLIWEAMHDVVLLILLAGAALTLIFGSIQHPDDGWIEGVAILVAVVIVVGVTVGNDYSKDKKFKKLLALQSDKKCKVIRDGREDQISSWDVVVGDLVALATGDEIPADGVFVKGVHLVVDESPLTGEAIPVKKSAKSPFVFSGCTVSEGSGTMLVTTVGELSTAGQIQALLSAEQEEETPLQGKLTKLAIQLGYIGLVAGVLTFIGLSIRWMIDINTDGEAWKWSRLGDLLDFFIVGVTIVVVAVPEGLPLAVTISLAFSMFKMIQENNFVRHLDASETMGGATTICSDKTGTLTENRMSVVQALVGEKHLAHAKMNSTDHGFGERVLRTLIEGICSNSSAFILQEEGQALPVFVGSATEGALLILARKLGFGYEDLRKEVVAIPEVSLPFTSARKRMTTVCRSEASNKSQWPSKYRSFTKGAAEIVLKLCTRILAANGSVEALTEARTAELVELIQQYAEDGLRTIVMAYRDLEAIDSLPSDDDAKLGATLEADLVFVGVVGIKDPVRAEVPKAVKLCQEAGIVVRMVTGDNLATARKISEECGILTSNGIILEGPVFRSLSDEDKELVAPRLCVLARSSPADKHELVTLLRNAGEVVAVTGDGTNDAPALKAADVGFAMGQSGTHVAMNASDIVLLDDNFSSIINAIRWGRNVFDSIRKFLQFQIAVNLVAISVTFIGSVAYGESPLSPVQLLWVNLIMDSLGALALATDNPSPTILQRKPHARNEPLITRAMMLYIIFQIGYQVVALCILLFVGYKAFDIKEEFADEDVSDRRGIYTLVFTTFVLLQVANEITARHLDFHTRIWHQQRNPLFFSIVVIICVVQVLVVEFGGDFTETISLTAGQWAGCALIAFLSIPACEIFKLLLQPKLRKMERKLKRKSAGDIELGDIDSLRTRLEGMSATIASPAQSPRGDPKKDEIKILIKDEDGAVVGTGDDVASTDNQDEEYLPGVDALWAKLRAASFMLGNFISRNPGAAQVLSSGRLSGRISRSVSMGSRDDTLSRASRHEESIREADEDNEGAAHEADADEDNEGAAHEADADEADEKEDAKEADAIEAEDDSGSEPELGEA